MKTDRFYIPSLDGIRAVAALLVFFTHAGLADIVPGGFGVSIFFFLSGFLITTLLRREYEKFGHINIKHFYLRRIYRIFPLLYLVLFSIVILSLAGIINSHFTIGALIAQVGQLTNYYCILHGEEHLVPFTQVYWSLAVEEHFYLLFPALFMFSVKRWHYGKVVYVFLGICLLTLLWRCILVYEFAQPLLRTYWATDTRLDSLLFGCIMGIWANPVIGQRQFLLGNKMKDVLMLLFSLVVLLLTLADRNEVFRETLRYTIQGVALFPVFWLAIRHADWPVFHWLNWKPVRWLGVLSYSFYLSHVFWLHVAHKITGQHQLLAGLLGFLLTVLFSALMYKWVERPFSILRQKLHA